MIVPWLERPIIYDVRARPNTITSTSGSRDLQMVNVSLRVLTRPDSRRLQDIYRTLGVDFDQRVLPSIIQETLKGVIAQYNASQLLTQREMVSKDIKRVLTERGAVFNIILEDVSITNLTFSREYTAAVEAKQVRSEPLLRAECLVCYAFMSDSCAIGSVEKLITGTRSPALKGGWHFAVRELVEVQYLSLSRSLLGFTL